jgi:hypothetical protein
LLQSKTNNKEDIMHSSTLFRLHNKLGIILQDLASASGGLARKLPGLEDYYLGYKHYQVNNNIEDENQTIKDCIYGLHDIRDRIYLDAVNLKKAEIAQALADAAKALVDATIEGAVWVGDQIEEGVEWVDDKIEDGVEWVDDKVEDGIEWAGDQIEEGVEWVDDKIEDGIDFLEDIGNFFKNL